MKSVRVFVATVLFALTVGTVAGTAAADMGSADYTTTASATPGDDSGWGRIAG